MDVDPARTAARRKRRVERLGVGCECAFCGYANPYALIRASRTLLEAHHAEGIKRNPDMTVVLCRNCHAEITEALARVVPMKRERDPVERVAGSLLALSIFHAKEAEALAKLAQTLLRRIK